MTPAPRSPEAGFALRGRRGQVIDAVGRAIVSGRYSPGELLPREEELCDEYGVSRTTIRGAMVVLSAKGLIDIRPKTGTRVRPRSLWNAFDSDLLSRAWAEGHGAEPMEDLVELRQVVEPAAARLAAARAGEADLDAMQRAVTTMSEHLHDPVGYADGDVAFHQAVYLATGNPLFERFGTLIADFMRLAFEMQHEHADAHGGLAEDARRHLDVSEAIARRDVESAADAMLAVVLDGKTALAAALSTNPPGVPLA